MRHHLLLLVLAVSSLDQSNAGKSITFGSRLVRKDGKHNDLLVPANKQGDAADTSTTDAESILQSSFEFSIASKPATIVSNEADDEKTVDADKDGQRRLRSLRRKRRTKEEVPAQYDDNNHRKTQEEEQLYWERFLADNLGSMTEPMTVSNDNMNTDTGGGSGTTDDTGSSTGTGSATTTTTTDGDAAAFPPGPCPTRVSLDCVSISDATMKCTDFVRPPTVQENDDCYASVEFLIYLSNAGNDVQRVYELSLTQSGDVTSFEDIVAGSLDLIPGEVAMVSLDAVINICTNDPDMAFDTQVDIISGPPCNIETSIGCVSEEGEECMNISQAPNDDFCMLEITYTYLVENTGDVDANIITFQRSRDDTIADLMTLLDSTFIAVGDTTQAQETQEIDRCVAQTFSTNTIVFAEPNQELLCEDTAFYP